MIFFFHSTVTDALCVLPQSHTQVNLRQYTSTRFVNPGQVVPCLSLANIEVDRQHRRKGHARRALRTLRKAATDNRRVLVVESARFATALRVPIYR